MIKRREMVEMKKCGSFIPTAILAVFGVTEFFFYDAFVNWNQVKYFIMLAIITVEMFITVFFFPKKKERTTKKNIILSLITSLLWVSIAVFGFIYLMNNILRVGANNACTDVCTINVIIMFVLSIISLKRGGIKKSIAAICLILSFAIGVLPIAKNYLYPLYMKNYNGLEVVPSNMGTYTEKEKKLVNDADFYVSCNGKDENDGSLSNPFASIEKARDAVRAMDKTGKGGITVAIMAGEYRVDTVLFTKEDSGTKDCPITYCSYGDGEVVINGGITMNKDSFSKVTDEEVANRFNDEVRDSVLCADLKEYGLTKEDWGKIYAIGSYNTAAQYDGDYVGGMYCELFFNDQRMTIARYPNEGWFVTDDVVETGYGRESNGATTAVENWYEVRNPKGDTYKLNDELKKRVASWKNLDDVWMFGFFKYTWADASTLIEKFDPETGHLTTKFVSVYGTDNKAPYYFFNVLEELDNPGEWYLDRDNGIIYMIPTSSMESAVVDLSISSKEIIKVDGANYLTFDGFTVKGTRGDAINITGNYNTVKCCLIKNVGGNALIMSGNDNLASENEITHTGRGGIYLDGGDRETLTAGNNKADNNLIHDWSEVYQTYQPAVTLSGVGNICSHNEIYNSPHEAITYSGNNHLIEYNNIHEVCVLSDDAGAIYSGRRWDWYGTVIRYNCIANIYGDGHEAVGIYLDDALSGQTVYGNFIINAGSIGIQLGGGRDLVVKNNILVNCNNRSFTYDDRARDGALNNGWFNHSSTKDGDMWTNLNNSPWKSEIWQEAYPQYKNYSDDFNNTDSPDFVPNPANSEVTDNLVISIKNDFGEISDSAKRFSTIENNAVFGIGKMDKIFTDSENGIYTLNKDSKLLKDYPQIEDIPFEEIGRY